MLPAVTYPSGWNYDHQDYGLYIKEARTEGYSFANAFAASGGYSLTDTVKTVGGTKLTDPNFPREISVSPGMMSPVFSSVSLYERIFYTFPDEGDSGERAHFFWEYYDLVDLHENVPTKPDEVKLSLSAKRLAAFYKDGKTTVEFVSDDSALAKLKKTYSSDPIAEMWGEIKSTDGNENKVTITDGDKKIELIIGKREITVNGKTEKLDAAPFIEDSRTLVPVRFISEALGALVTYDEKTKPSLSKNKIKPPNITFGGLIVKYHKLRT